MDTKMISAVLVLALLGGLAAWLSLPEPLEDTEARLPWRTTLDDRGRLQVFGFTLGETHLGQVQETFDHPGETTLFAPAEGTEGRYTVEVYFEQVYLSRLRADFVITLDASQEVLGEMYQRGRRISRLGDGTQKVTLAPSDEQKLRDWPIAHITYLPMARLDPDLLQTRFGEPTQRLREPNGILHWLYPHRGLDIARDAGGRILIQYVNPADFERLHAPLRAASNADRNI